MSKFDHLKQQKAEEVEELFQKYEVEVRKTFEQYSVEPYYEFNAPEGKTIKLSNSTTPMSCY